jgi:hypothetical protein
LSKRGIELNPDLRAKTREVPPFAVSAAAVTDREPERSEQVVFIGDRSRRHYDGCDCIVHDLLLRRQRHAAGLATASQLAD